MDSNQSVQSPAPLTATSGVSAVERQGERLDPFPVGQYQPAAANQGAEAVKTVHQTVQQVSRKEKSSIFLLSTFVVQKQWSFKTGKRLISRLDFRI